MTTNKPLCIRGNTDAATYAVYTEVGANAAGATRVTGAEEGAAQPRAERQADGIASAQRRQIDGRMLPGKKHIGRPTVIGPAELATLQSLIADGKSITEAARTLKIGHSTAYAALAAAAPRP